MNSSRKSIFVVAGFADSICAFRGDLIKLMVASGHRLTVMAAPTSTEIEQDIQSLGVEFVSYPIERNGTNPFKDLKTKRFLRSTFESNRPDLVLAYTIKPIIWGGIALRTVQQSRFSALITGLGYSFQSVTFKQRTLCMLTSQLYGIALRRASNVIFQNQDNKNVFVQRGIVPESKCYVVPGSGINLSNFVKCPIPTGDIRFLLIARLLKEKGIREYVEAAKIVKKQFPTARFLLVGPSDPSPDGIPLDVVKNWDSEGVIEYRGATTDVRPFLNDCHVFVLPSYHEGMPRTVLEAMATGRPILTTDVCGCRETVENGRNGWLVPKADSQALAERMIWFLKHPSQLAIMGNESRKLAEQRFDVELVNTKMLEILQIQ